MWADKRAQYSDTDWKKKKRHTLDSNLKNVPRKKDFKF